MQKILESFLKAFEGKIETPLYLYSAEQLKKNIEIFKKLSRKNIEIFFALKANNYSSLVKELANSDFGFDIASKEELAYLMDLGVDPKKITFSAPSKKEEDIKYASKVGVVYYAFDSEIGARKIIENVESPILFARIAHHSKNAVFNLSSKFGMHEEYFKSILKIAKKEAWPLKGLTFHVGSQNRSTRSWHIAMKHAQRLMEKGQAEGIIFSYLNIGGGMPAQYTKSDLPLDVYIDAISTQCDMIQKTNPSLKIFVEPGRSICASTTALLTKVIDYKPYKSPPILVVDTGVFNGIIEPLEHLEYPVFVPKRNSKKNSFFRIVGFSCEGYDIIRNKVLLPSDIKVGDEICILNAGAYTFVYSKFHMVPYPNIKEIN